MSFVDFKWSCRPDESGLWQGGEDEDANSSWEALRGAHTAVQKCERAVQLEPPSLVL
jgi:hypothetical protein